MKSQNFEAEIDSLSHGAFGIARGENGVVFVENTCPGDKISGQIYDQRKDFAYAHLETLIHSSELREADPKCRLHKICGSCQWQHISYSAQLNFKQQNLLDLLRKSNIVAELIEEPLGMEQPWNYRNKVMYPVELVSSTARVIAGYYKRNSHELINVKYCPIQYSIFDEIIEKLKELLSENDLKDKLLRHILLRSNIDFSEILVSLVLRKSLLNQDLKKRIVEVLEDIKTIYPEIQVISLNYNDDSTNVILGRETEVLSEKSTIRERFGAIELDISTVSFFQVNTRQFLKITNKITDLICQINPKKVLDIYSGIGTITLTLAKAFPQVDFLGVEIIDAAVDNAKANALLNHCSNVDFVASSIENYVAENLDLAAYDCIILNPPRKGAHRTVLDSCNQSQAGHVIYVSCNPATLVRDIKILEGHGFRLKFIQAIDMFPHSYHFETLAYLARD